MRCSAITRTGGRCRLDATHGDHCYQHAPETASERSRNARRANSFGGNGRPGRSELVQIKAELRQVIDAVREGRIERSVGAVVFQGYGYLLRAVELERKIREADELEVRLEALERVAGGVRWQA